MWPRGKHAILDASRFWSSMGYDSASTIALKEAQLSAREVGFIGVSRGLRVLGL